MTSSAAPEACMTDLTPEYVPMILDYFRVSLKTQPCDDPCLVVTAV